MSETTYSKGCKRNRNRIIIFIVNGRLKEENMDYDSKYQLNVKKYENIVTTISYPKVGAMGKTGTWRIFKPILDKDKCVKCLRCWRYSVQKQ